MGFERILDIITTIVLTVIGIIVFTFGIVIVSSLLYGMVKEGLKLL